MKRYHKSNVLYLSVFGAVICTALFLHLFQISNIPCGINVDEMGMGYDAWCLAHFGVDRYLKEYPVYLMNFGGGQSALYAYLCAPLVRLFGLSVLTIRLPGILLYMLALICGTRVFLTGDKDRRKALAGMAAMTVLPSFIMLFRIGMDCNLMLAMSVIFLYLLSRAVVMQKTAAYIWAGAAGGILLYTYAISYVVMPIFVVLMLVYLLAVRKISARQVLAFGIPLALLAAPLIAVQVINMFDLPEFKMGPFTITKLFQYRSGDIGLSNLSLTSVRKAFMSIFMFDELRYNTLPAFGTVYYVSLPFIMIGIVKSVVDFAKSIRAKTFSLNALYLIWLVLLFAAGCFMDANTNRLNAALAAVPVILVEGIWQAVSWAGSAGCRRIVVTVTIGAYMISFGAFCIYYFGGAYAKDYEKLEYFDFPLDEAVAYVENDEQCSSQTTYISSINQTYIYYLSANRISPYDFNKDNIFDREDPFIYDKWTAGYGKYRFGMPEQLDWNANYIVDHNNTACNELLRESGYEEHRLEHYSVYTFDLNTFGQLDGDAEIVWWTGVDEQNHIAAKQDTQLINDVESVVLVGWSYDKAYVHTWDSVYLQLGDECYYAELVEEADIAEQLENPELLRCGILLIIPKYAFENQDNAVLTLMDTANKVYARQNIAINH